MLRLLWRQNGLFGDHVFDLGIFDQGLWLLSRGRDPFVSLRGLHLFADHSSYALILLTPLYWLWADARMLLIVTVACVASGGPLVHAIARRHGLSAWAAAGLAVAYLLNPVVLWQAWEDFHPEILAIPGLLGAYYLARGSRPLWALAPLAIVLLAKEDAALVVLPLAVLFLLDRPTRRLGAVAGALAVVALVANFGFLLPHFSPTGELIYTGRYDRLGTSLGEIVRTALLEPWVVLDALFVRDSVVYLGWTVLPLFAAVWAPRVLLVGLPITTINLVSSFPYQHEARRHYTIYFITLVALAAVAGAGRVASSSRTRLVPLLVGGMVAAAVVGQLLIGPDRQLDDAWTGRVASADVDDVDEALRIIPSDAILAADTQIAARLAHREDVYRLPVPWQRLDWGTDRLPRLPATASVEWIAVLEPVDRNPAIAALIDDLLRRGEFAVRHDDELLVILQRVVRRIS